MSKKSTIYLGAGIGGTLGGFLPALWGGSTWGAASILTSTLGGVFGIWFTYRFMRS